MSSIAVISAGSFGTALAFTLSKRGHQVKLHVRETDTFQVIKTTKSNATYLPGFVLDENIVAAATTRIAEAVRGVEFVLLTVPSQYARQTARDLRDYLEPKAVVILTSKGMLVEGDSMSEILRQEIPQNQLCGLYGITFANHVASGEGLSSMCIASPNRRVAEKVAKLFVNHAPLETTANNLRIYVTDDLRGVEFGGAMKNVYAIAMGIFDGYFLFLQSCGNISPSVQISRHSLLSECIVEFIRFGLSHGAKMYTLLGSSGIGDIQACATELSRNYRYGCWRAKVELEKTPEKAPDLHEGYDTVQAAMKLSSKYGLDTPILKATHDILFDESRNIKEVVPSLLKKLTVAVDRSEEEKFNNLLIDSIRIETKPHVYPSERQYKTTFISYSFTDPDSDKYMRVTKSIGDIFGMEFTTGHSEGAKPSAKGLSEDVINKIKKADLYIAIFVKGASPSTWMIEELTCAIAENKEILLFVEKGTPQEDLGHLRGDHPCHRFTKKDFPLVLYKQLKATCDTQDGNRKPVDIKYSSRKRLVDDQKTQFHKF